MKQIAIFFIHLYKWLLSPLVGSNCRFTPSCSTYAITAIEKRGFFAGSWLSIKRIIRCNPWNSNCGIDEP